jgi:hypothetical protein
MGDENFDEMVEALKFKRDQFLAAKEREGASPDEALLDWGKVTSSWRNRMATCVIRHFPGTYASALCVCISFRAEQSCAESVDDKVTVSFWSHLAVEGKEYHLAKRVRQFGKKCQEAHRTRGKEAKKNWSVKLDQLKELGVVFPCTIETLPNRQLQPIAQVRVTWYCLHLHM